MGVERDGVQPSGPWPHELCAGCAVQAVEFRHKQPRGVRKSILAVSPAMQQAVISFRSSFSSFALRSAAALSILTMGVTGQSELMQVSRRVGATQAPRLQ